MEAYHTKWLFAVGPFRIVWHKDVIGKNYGTFRPIDNQTGEMIENCAVDDCQKRILIYRIEALEAARVPYLPAKHSCADCPS